MNKAAERRAIQTSSSAGDYGLKTYSGDDEKLLARFRANRVRLIIQYGDSTYPAIDGVSVATTTADVVGTFGEPAFVAKEDEGASRIYCYSSYQAHFYLTKDRAEVQLK